MFKWYPWFTQKWRGATRHMTLAEKGAYRELIDEYMTNGGALENNARALAAIAGCSLQEWAEVSETVLAKFEQSHGKLVHPRCEEELLVQQSYSTAKAEAGRKGGLAKAKNYNEMLAVLQHSQGSAIANRSTLHNTKNLSSYVRGQEKKDDIQERGFPKTPELASLVQKKSNGST